MLHTFASCQMMEKMKHKICVSFGKSSKMPKSVFLRSISVSDERDGIEGHVTTRVFRHKKTIAPEAQKNLF